MKHFLQTLPKRVAQTMTSFGLLLATSSMFGQITSYPFQEGFEAETLPAGWTTEYLIETVDWTFPTQNSYLMPIGERMAVFRTGNDNKSTTKLVTPALDLTSLTRPYLNFSFVNLNYSNLVDELKFFYKTSLDGAWIQFGATEITPQFPWREIGLMLPSPSADYYVAFQGKSNKGNGLNIDNVWIGEGPPCADTVGLNATQVSPTSSRLSWIANGSNIVNYDVEWGPAGFTVGTNAPGVTQLTETGTSTIVPTNADTPYEFYVRSNCGATDGISNWIGPFAFETTFCIPQGFLTTNEYYVSSFTTTGADINLNYYGSSSGGGYKDRTSIPFEATPGALINFNIAQNTSTSRFFVWVDWNNNSTFTDDGERILFTLVYQSSESGTINVPQNQPAGSYRVRIANTFAVGGPFSPCGTSNNGDYIDFLLTISAVDVQGLPYSEDFTTNTWILNNGTQTNKWHIGSAVGNPANALYISNNAASNAYTVTNAASVVHAYKLIAFPNTTNDFSLSFDWKGVGESTFDYMRVWMIPITATTTPGTQITPGNTPGAIQVSPNYLDSETTWKTENFTLANSTFAGASWQLVFEWRNDAISGENPPAAVDNILIKEVTCPKPTALVSSNVATSSFDISWTAGGTETSWDVEMGAPGFTPGTGNEIVGNLVNATSHSFNNLTSLTFYDVYVRAVCSGGEKSFWEGPLNVLTPQAAATIPYTEDFATNTWLIHNGTQTNQWHIGSAVGNPANALYISSDAGQTNTYTLTSNSVVHAAKLITFPVSTGPFELSFDWKGQGENLTNIDYDYMRVWMIPGSEVPTPGTQISTTDIPGAIQVGGNFNQEANWKTETFELPNTIAGAEWNLVFEWRNDTSGGTNPPAAVDNISIIQLSCGMPTGLTATQISVTSATLSWTTNSSNAVDYDVEWGPAGFIVDTNAPGVTVLTEAGTSISVTTVMDQDYEFYVRQNCGTTDGVSNWAGPFAFKTGYCTPAWASDSEWISKFTTTGTTPPIDNSSGDDSGYGNYTSISTTVNEGASFGFTVEVSYYSTNWPEGLAIWIDENQNGIFDPTERVYASTTVSTTGFSGNITAPANAGTYRMRVLIQYGQMNPTDPCDVLNNGEIEDYTLVVAPTGFSCPSPINAGTVTVNPSSGSAETLFDVSATGFDTGSGINYTWENSIDNGTTWNVVGTPNATTYADLTGQTASITTQYRLRVTCGGTPENSDPATFTVTVGRDDFDMFGFAYYPNPVSDMLHLSSNTPISSVVVSNMLGQQVSISLNSDNTNLDLSNLPTGNYLVKVEIEGVFKTFKVIKK